MKIALETIFPDTDSSFRVFSPRLHDLFYWHYHPEYEIVYIEGTDGPRHIGDHISRYTGSDLVLIGPYIPHLNFDYGVKTNYEKVVVQMKEDFLGKEFLSSPELSDIHQLFEKARSGLAFTGETKQRIGTKLKQLAGLRHFHQLMALLEIFQELACSKDSVPLQAKPIESHYNLKEQQRLKRIYHYVEENFQRTINMQEVVELCHLSQAAFCRYFKKMTRLTFTEFLNQYRIHHAKNLLLQDYTVTEACYESGFENLSYFNKTFKKFAGENPMQFKKRHLAVS